MDPAHVFEAREIDRHRIINETIARQKSPVQQFYAGAVVLVTGASGFLGKQLIEKLLRSCQIKKIFILMRPKKGKTIQERFLRLLRDPLYETLQPGFEENIVAVQGDVTEPHLGISERDWSTITEEYVVVNRAISEALGGLSEYGIYVPRDDDLTLLTDDFFVDIIFHGAATIQFTEPLKKATLTNVRGTREMLLLGKACKKLRSFVHISTAYAHATTDRIKQPVQEQFYDIPISADDLIRMVEEVDEQYLDEMTPKLIKGWPNTYAFTKAVAEHIVRSMAEQLPVCIVRPAIVICAYREPLPGWLDRSCAMGPSGFILGTGLGVLHLLYANNKSKLDLVPVDFANNASMIAAYETAQRRTRGVSDDVKIYTITGNRNPLLFGTMVKVLQEDGHKFPTNKSVWYSYGYQTKNKLCYFVLYWLLHYIPGYLADGILILLGRKPLLTEVYKKAYKLNTIFGVYMTNDWSFGDSNLCELYWSLSPADRTIFDCNMATVDWNLYILLWCIGCRKYIVKDGLKDTEKAIRKQFILKILHYLFVLAYFYVLYKCLYVCGAVTSFVLTKMVEAF